MAKNKEDDRLPQINLALLFGEKSGLAFYYRKLAGKIPDVRTVQNLLADFVDFGFAKVNLVMDCGFYSEANVDGLLKEHLKFSVAIQTSKSFVRKALDTVYDNFRFFDNFDEQCELYAKNVLSEWEYKQERPYKKDVLTDKKRVYWHIYFNIDKFGEDETNFDCKLMAMRKAIMSGKRVANTSDSTSSTFKLKILRFVAYRLL